MANWLKKWWWVLLLGVGLAATALYLLFRKPKQGPVTESSFVSKAREKIKEAETDARLARAKSDARSEEEKRRLKSIEEIKDGRERREKLARYLDEEL